MNKMNFENLSVLRIYFHYGQKATNLSFWHKLWNNNLGELLLKKAKEMNIEKVYIFTTKVNFNISETSLIKNPVCLELIDHHERLKLFIEQNKAELSKIHMNLLTKDYFKMTS